MQQAADSTKSAPRPIEEIAAEAGLAADEIERRGDLVAKVRLGALARIASRPQGRYVVVTGVTPTSHGEGKTTTVVGLVDALRRRGRKAFGCVRQPSLGPTLGMKGGGAGGGRSLILPTEAIGLHLTGDVHAVGAAHNLLAAALDARLYHERRRSDADQSGAGLDRIDIDERSIRWPRVIDMNDRALRHIRLNVGDDTAEREAHFEVTAASEVMAVMALAADLHDLRERLGRIVVAHTRAGRPVTAATLGAAGAMAALLRDALMPNLLQTAERAPVFVHAGPFANLSTGCSSVIADRLALGLAGERGYVVTEAGFGADVGLEKFVHLKCRSAALAPGCAVLVATVRALAWQGATACRTPIEALEAGCENLGWHIGIARGFGLPVVVAVNRYPGDTDAEVALVLRRAFEFGAEAAAPTDHFALGGAGAAALAEAVESVWRRAPLRFLYEPGDPLAAKVEVIARAIYNADGADWSEAATGGLDALRRDGAETLPVCIAKTPYSISHDPALRNVPRGYRVPVREVRPDLGAGHVLVMLGEVLRMPGLGVNPRFRALDVDAASGRIVGLD